MAAGTTLFIIPIVCFTVLLRKHLLRGSFGNRKTRCGGGTGVWMRAFRRFGVSNADLPSWRRRAWTRSELRSAVCTACPATVDDTIDSSANIIGNVERPFWSDCQARWTMRRLVGGLHGPGKSVGKYLALTGCVIARQSLKHHVITALRIGRPIPRSVEGDKHAVAIMSGELQLVIQRHRVRRPVCGKRRNRSDVARAGANLLAPVATVLGSEHESALRRVVVTFGPPVVTTAPQAQQLFRRESSFLLRPVQIRPIRMQLVASVLCDEDAVPRRIDCEAFCVAYAGGKALRR